MIIWSILSFKKSSFAKLLSFFVCQFLSWEKSWENWENFFSQNSNPSTKRVKTHYQNWHPNLPIIAEDVKKYKCYQCIDFFFLQEELDCHLNLQHGVKTDKNYCKRQGYLLRGIDNCSSAAWSMVGTRPWATFSVTIFLFSSQKLKRCYQKSFPL